MHYKLLYPNEYLCAADLQGKDVVLTISNLKQEELRTDKGNEDRWVIYFKEMEERSRKDRKKLNKRLVLNKTNAKSIAKVWGTDTDNWVGKRITIYATVCQAFGQTVDCIRVREKAPRANGKAPEDFDPPNDAREPGYDDEPPADWKGTVQ